VRALEGDERHGFAHDKGQPQWEAELIDPESKFIVSHVQGKRDKALIRRLLEDGASRLANRHRPGAADRWRCHCSPHERSSGSPFARFLPSPRHQNGPGLVGPHRLQLVPPSPFLAPGDACTTGQKKVRASNPGDGPGPYRSCLVCSRAAPHPCLLSRRSEIISCHYRFMKHSLNYIACELEGWLQTGYRLAFDQAAGEGNPDGRHVWRSRPVGQAAQGQCAQFPGFDPYGGQRRG
jgi:hypothetical protein